MYNQLSSYIYIYVHTEDYPYVLFICTYAMQDMY